MVTASRHQREPHDSGEREVRVQLDWRCPGTGRKDLEAAKAAKGMLYAPVVKAGEYKRDSSPEMAGLFVHEAFGHLSEADSLMRTSA